MALHPTADHKERSHETPQFRGQPRDCRLQHPQPGRPSMTVFVFGTVLPWLLIGVGIWLGFQLVRQNRPLLLRLAPIEKQLAPRAGAKPPEAGGLTIGTLRPDFELPDITGV